MKRREKIYSSMILVAMFFAVAGAAFGAYPEKAVQLIVPYPPGGISDLTARVLAANIEPFLGQQLLVVNKPGGGGAIGGFAVTRGEPGYTLGIFAPVLAFPEYYRQEAAYTSADVRPVARQFMMLTTIVVKSDAPPNNMKEFIQWVEKNPGMKYGHTGKGATTHLVGVDLADLLGLNMVDLPFQGDSQVVTAVLGGTPQSVLRICPGSFRTSKPEPSKPLPSMRTSGWRKSPWFQRSWRPGINCAFHTHLEAFLPPREQGNPNLRN